MTNTGISFGNFCCVFLIATCIVFTSAANADKKHKSSKHGYHGGGGHTQLSITPYGLGFGYQDRNFGIQIGSGGFGFAPAVPVVPVAPAIVPVPEICPHAAPPVPILVNPYAEGFGPVGPTNPAPFDPQLVPPRRGIGSNGPETTERNRAFDGRTIPSNRAAAKFKTRAKAEFRAGNYEEARRQIGYALLKDNSNGFLLLFASNTSMALKDYERAVLELGAATGRLHQNQWDFFVRNSEIWYPENGYQQQLKQLDEFCAKESYDFAFVLRGFHRACDGLNVFAQRDFYTALAINPDNNLAKRLQSRLQAHGSRTEQLPPAVPQPPEPNAVPNNPGPNGQVNGPVSGVSVEVPPTPQNFSPMKSVIESRFK